MKLTKCFKTIIVIGLILAAYGIVGKMDYEDELKYQEYSCKMVEDGYWPKEQCKK